MVLVNRKYWAQWEERLPRLMDAIAHAARSGDPLARQVHTGQMATTIDKMIALFTRGESKSE